MKLKFNSCLPAALFAGALFVGNANAATTVPQVELFSFVPNGDQTLNFDKFDPSLGSLTKVTISWSLSKTGGSLFIDNESPTPGSGDITQTVEVDLVSSDVTLISTTFSPIGSGVDVISTYSATVTADNGDSPVTAEPDAPGNDFDGTSFGPEGPNSGSADVNSLFFADYIGASQNFDITVDGLQFVDFSAISGVTFTGAPATANGSVSVTYEYTPTPTAIPEPSTALLGALGFVGLVLRRRR